MKRRRPLKKTGLDSRGSLMILSLWLFLILGLFALGLVFRVRLEARILKVRAAAGALTYDALTAVNFSRTLIENEESPMTDFKEDVWYGKIPMERFHSDFGPSISEIEITDEESRLNINLAPPAVLESFFKLLEQDLKTPAKTWVAGILYWRGASWDKEKKEEGAFYKEAPFDSLEEVYLLPEVRAEDIAVIRPYLAVYPKVSEEPFKVNVNTVPDLILKALIRSVPGGETNQGEELYDRWVAFRKGQGGNSESSYLRSGFSPEAFCQLLSLDVSKLALVNLVLASAVTDSRYFEVKVRQEGRGSGVSAVLGPHLYEINKLDILGWQRQ